LGLIILILISNFEVTVSGYLIMQGNSIDIIVLLLMLGAIHGFILAVFLWTIRGVFALANRILAWIILLFSLIILMHTLFHIGYSLDFGFLPSLRRLLQTLFGPLLIYYAVALLFGPLVYFYVVALTQGNFRFKRSHIIHFLPALVVAFAVVPWIFRGDDSSIHQHGSDWASKVSGWLAFVHALTYVGIAAGKLKSSGDAAKSKRERSKLKWLRLFLIAFVTTWIGAIFMEVYGGNAESWNYVWIIASIFIYTVGYIGMKRPEIFTGSERTYRKYERSTLTPENARIYLQKLDDLMQEEKPFLKSDITLSILAQKLSISTHHLSQIINQYFHQNFFDYINQRRIEEAKLIMANPKKQHLNISAIAYEVGFNSISAFNTAFKKHTDLTPSKFKQNS